MKEKTAALSFGQFFARWMRLRRDDMLAMLREVCGLTSLGVFQIGATIGVHTGPHPIGIGLLRRA